MVHRWARLAAWALLGRPLDMPAKKRPARVNERCPGLALGAVTCKKLLAERLTDSPVLVFSSGRAGSNTALPTEQPGAQRPQAAAQRPA